MHCICLSPKVFFSNHSSNADVKETYENTDGSQELGAGGTLSDRMDSEIRAEPYHDVISSDVLK